jgi:hypothetical protein
MGTDPMGLAGRFAVPRNVARALRRAKGKVANRLMTNYKFRDLRVNTKMLDEFTEVNNALLHRLDERFPGLEVPYGPEGTVDFAGASYRGMPEGDTSIVFDDVHIGEFKNEKKDIADAWAKYAKDEELTPAQLEELQERYVMHHDYEDGRLLLVDKNVHDAYRHTGGNALRKAGLYAKIGLETGATVVVYCAAPNLCEAVEDPDVTPEEIGKATVLDLYYLTPPGEVHDAANTVLEVEEWAFDKAMTWEDDEGWSVLEVLSTPWAAECVFGDPNQCRR